MLRTKKKYFNFMTWPLIYLQIRKFGLWIFSGKVQPSVVHPPSSLNTPSITIESLQDSVWQLQQRVLSRILLDYRAERGCCDYRVKVIVKGEIIDQHINPKDKMRSSCQDFVRGVQNRSWFRQVVSWLHKFPQHTFDGNR